VVLVAEVSDPSLAYGRSVKRRLYAQAGITEYWVVDAQAEAVEAYHDPLEGRFQTSRVYGREAGLIGTGVPELEVAVEDIFGPLQPEE
jgi:Uma2 family endonuclease